MTLATIARGHDRAALALSLFAVLDMFPKCATCGTELPPAGDGARLRGDGRRAVCATCDDTPRCVDCGESPRDHHGTQLVRHRQDDGRTVWRCVDCVVVENAAREADDDGGALRVVDPRWDGIDTGGGDG